MTVKVLNDKTLLVIKSSKKLEEIEFLQKFLPDALRIADAEGEPRFSVCIAKEGDGRLNNIGAEFAPVADANGLAKITIALPVCNDVKDYIADNYGQAIADLKEIESKLERYLVTAQQRLQEVKSLINIVE